MEFNPVIFVRLNEFCCVFHENAVESGETSLLHFVNTLSVTGGQREGLVWLAQAEFRHFQQNFPNTS